MALTQPESIVKADSVIGVKVKSSSGDNLGNIENIMIDKTSGEVRYVVLSFGGLLGIGESLHALPWNALSYSTEENGFIVNIDKDTLKKAPGFDKNNWPDMADPLWKQTMQSYYGDYEHLKEKAKESFNYVTDKAKQHLEKGAQTAKQSGQEWLDYVQAHPIQSIAFGLISYFALKGMMQD